ncbi:MAG: glycosyltransferase [Candidatus Falkowbacteria bacterium]|nr:glycosyltransferase [Candidatus Falkowbacteria bacterium]
MKIGLMHNLYGEYSRGGAETAVNIMANNFRADGQQVFMITTRPKSGRKVEIMNGDAKIYYINSEFYNLNKRSRFYRALWQIGNIFSFRKAGEIKKILKLEKPDLIITHNLMGLGFMVPSVLRQLNIRHEHWLHDIQLLHPSGLMIFKREQKINKPTAKIYQALTRALFASPVKVTSPSDWLLEMHKQRGFFKDSEHEVRPFIWPKTTIQNPLRNGLAKNFLFIGQVEEQKGIFLLINAFKKIKRPELTLTIAIRGGGGSLEKARAAAGTDARIKFLGPLSYEETEKVKAASDCLIVPSLCYENSPTTIYGAQAAGLPVIASRLGGVPELMGKDDRLFAPGDENDLREKILLMTEKTGA